VLLRWLNPASIKDLPALQQAAVRGDTRRIEELLAQGASLSQVDRDGWTALHWAIGGGQLAAIQLLLGRRADPNASFPGLQDYIGAPSDVISLGRFERDYKQAAETPLGVAITGERVDIAQLLVQHGAQIEKRRRDGRTPLMFAAHWCCPKSVQFLLERGADVAAVDENGWTALHYAAQAHQSDCVEILVRNGADPSAASTKSTAIFGQTHWTLWEYEKGATPLHVAVTALVAQTPTQEHQVPTAEQIAAVKALLAGGANPRAKDASHHTPLDYAKQGWASTELADVLRSGTKGD
jgi:ankyrin repeat protein